MRYLINLIAAAMITAGLFAVADAIDRNTATYDDDVGAVEQQWRSEA